MASDLSEKLKQRRDELAANIENPDSQGYTTGRRYDFIAGFDACYAEMKEMVEAHDKQQRVIEKLMEALESIEMNCRPERKASSDTRIIVIQHEAYKALYDAREMMK